MNPNTDETIALLKSAQLKSDDALLKNFTQPSSSTTGLQAYNLEAPSKKLYPVLTPLRNRIPRRGGGFATQANWKAITGINTANQRAGVAEGVRGGAVSHSLSEFNAAFRGIGLEKSVTFEADYASRTYEDIKALAVLQTLQALMIQEEMLILGGNTSNAMGTTPTPTVTATNSGGSLAAQTWSIICVAMGMQAYWDVAGYNNGGTGASLSLTSAVVPGVISRTNADGTTTTFNGGTAQQSAAASQATTGGASVLNCSVADVRGAVAYAWYIGLSGAERLAAISTINSVVISTAPGGSNQLASALAASDNSASTLDFDGLLTFAQKSGTNAYYKALATGTVGTGTTLTAGSGRVVEIDAALADRYSLYRMQPEEILLNYVQFQKITNLVLGATNPNVYFTVNVNDPATVMAGRNVGKYISPINGKVIDLVVHPNMPPGTMLFNTMTVPEYVDGVSDVVRVQTRQDYYQIDWPLITRKYQYGVYADEVLQHYLPFTLGVIKNVA